MKKLLKPFLIIFVYVFIVFLFSMIFSLFQAIPSDITILEKDSFNYRIQSGLLLFCKLLFATLATGTATGFTWTFATEADPRKHTSSAFMLPLFRMVLIVVTACTLLFIVAADLIQPTAETRQKRMIQDAANFEDYTLLAEQHASRHEYVSARFYAESALALNPDDADAKQLSKQMDTLAVTADDYVEDTELELEEALSYLQRAQKAWDENDYWNAHYYAVLAEDTSPRNDETLRVARELAANAWNMLGTYTEGVSADTEEIYFSKKAAYDYLEQDDILQAYYAFRRLTQQYPKDQDIAKYYEAAKTKLEALYFYTDETTDTRAFEKFNNIRFTLENDDGGKDLYEIKGITVVGNTGQLIQYLRDMRITHYDQSGKITSMMNCPYAKMTAQSITLDRQVEYQPFILLESVSKDTDIERMHVKPNWIISDGSEAPSYLLLDMPYDDFTLIRQAAAGPDLMPLVSLFKFVSKADRYGFSSASYRTTLILRLSLPLFVLAILLLMACIGWNFRLEPDQPFRTRWILMFPLFTFVMYIAKDLLLYILKLLVFILCDYVPVLALSLVVLSAFVCVLLASIRFVTQRSE